MAGIPARVAGHVLYHYGDGGEEPGGFTSALLLAFMRADTPNFARLSSAFPEYGEAMTLAKYTDNGVAALRAIHKEGRN